MELLDCLAHMIDSARERPMYQVHQHTHGRQSQSTECRSPCRGHLWHHCHLSCRFCFCFFVRGHHLSCTDLHQSPGWEVLLQNCVGAQQELLSLSLSSPPLRTAATPRWAAGSRGQRHCRHFAPSTKAACSGL